jgi:sulfur carrier protein
MKLNVSGILQEFQNVTNLESLVTQLNVESGGTAVAVNDRVIRRSVWSEHQLSEGDRVEIVRAVQGG